MRLRPTALLAVLALAVVPGAGHAKTYTIGGLLGSKLGKLTASTPLPVLLPQSLPLDYDGRVYSSVAGGRSSWSASFAGAPNCGGANACFLADVTGTKGGKPSNTRHVKLRGGVTGYFRPLSCGGSCSPPSIQWKRSSVLYEIQARVAVKGRTDRQLLTAAANSALAHGPR